MKILITGVCGFVGSSLAISLLNNLPDLQIHGLDNFIRAGSEENRITLQKLGIKLYHCDLRMASDFESLPPVDWIIDAAAIPSVLSGVDGNISSRQLVEHNLLGTINILEYCKRSRSGFILLSSSRVYSIAKLAQIALDVSGRTFKLKGDKKYPLGLSTSGVNESFSTSPPISLYGSSKLTSEIMALEYGQTYNFPVWINRCGVLAGAGQFCRGDQGIFSYWINSWLHRSPLAYIGFGGHGYQVRDCLHPRDLVPLLVQQMNSDRNLSPQLFNIGGGTANAISLAELSAWCSDRFGAHDIIQSTENRRFDVPWLIMDTKLAKDVWQWQPQTPLNDILEEIALHAEKHPHWLELSRFS
jgi:CDP-paratose 2-epimerase